MKKILFFCFIFFATTLISQTTSQKIENRTSTLASKGKLERDLSRQLNEIAKKLSQEELSLRNTNKNIEIINFEVSKQQSIVKNSENELQVLQKYNKELLKQKQEAEEKLIKIIAQEFSYFLVIDDGYEENYESLVIDEALKQISEISNEEFKKYAEAYTKADNKIKEFSLKIKIINEEIDALEKKKITLAKLKKDKAKIISEVEKEKKAYDLRLETVKNEQKELQKTLQSLNILLIDESKVKATPSENIRHVGSSYQASKVKKYAGKKTIAPLEKYTLLQKFGDYLDPIYNIKIFNESVVLRSQVRDVGVRSVLDGKVIFAKETQMLKNVVILENSDGIHTIYAHLSKIAPTIKVGNKIKKGYTIGRVDNDLTFEVTQQNFHINPMELIAQ